MYKYFYMVLILLVLSACGSSSNNSDISNEAPTPTPPATAILDCLDLNPDKVYLLGTLQEDERVYALTDPLDPNVFCVGFPNEPLHQATISDLNHFVYAPSSIADKNIYLMHPEELIRNAGGYWIYPSYTTDNDTILFTSGFEDCGFSTIKLASKSESVFYSCPNDTINTEMRAPYYDVGPAANSALLSVLTDGTMLVSKFGGGSRDLILVDRNLNEISLELPIPDADTMFGTAKQYVNPLTGNQSIWVQVIYHEVNIYSNSRDVIIDRLSIDLSTLEVVNEGEFSRLPLDAELTAFEGVFDGSGNLWQKGRSISDFEDDMLIRRPLATSENASEIVYRESNYREREVYFGSKQLCEYASFADRGVGNCTGGDYGWRFYENLFVKMNGFSQLVTGN